MSEPAGPPCTDSIIARFRSALGKYYIGKNRVQRGQQKMEISKIKFSVPRIPLQNRMRNMDFFLLLIPYNDCLRGATRLRVASFSKRWLKSLRQINQEARSPRIYTLHELI